MKFFKKFPRTKLFAGCCILFFLSLPIVSKGLAFDQSQQDDETELLKKAFIHLQHRLDILQKLIDDVLWYHRVGDICHVDKVRITGPPNPHEKNPTAMGAKNPIKFYCYVFIPKGIDRSKKYPLLVFPHGGVHADFTTYYAHIVRELMAQHYIVIAPEYRGSTGYGPYLYELIDYGGLEVEDNHAARNYMIKNYTFVDSSRVGIIGWSHGGLIALMNIFDHPDDYQAAFAGVPVSDLISRMGYMTDDYRALYSADYHIGKTANEDVEEYRRRSPAYNAHKFKNTPLLIHSSTNDEDVNVLEVEHLIKSLKAEGKKFEYEIFQDAPGGHSFDRMDLMFAKKVRAKIYSFLAKHLSPDKPIRSVEALIEASYQ